MVPGTDLFFILRQVQICFFYSELIFYYIFDY